MGMRLRQDPPRHVRTLGGRPGVLEAVCGEGLDTKVARVTVEVRFGQEVPEILASVRKFESDLLVMGAKGRYSTAASPLGNVARKLIDHAPCSVLNVRPSGKDKEFPGPISR